MDETSLRALLERALVPEPPIGPVADHSLRAGIKLRRRRRMRAAAGGAAAIAVIAVAIPVVTGALGSIVARRTGTAQAETLYVAPQPRPRRYRDADLDDHQHAGQADQGRGEPMAIAITPDGKTVYVANGYSDTVTPITTATNTPGQADQGREGSLPDRYHAEWADRLRCQLRIGHGDADHHRDQHGGQADQGRVPPQLDCHHAGWEDGLRCQRGGSPRLGHGDADHHRDQHSRQADQGRGVAPDDRDDAGWEDRLCHRREHSNANSDSDQHAW